MTDQHVFTAWVKTHGSTSFVGISDTFSNMRDMVESDDVWVPMEGSVVIYQYTINELDSGVRVASYNTAHGWAVLDKDLA